jgi:predicted nucleotidyltransferase
MDLRNGLNLFFPNNVHLKILRFFCSHKNQRFSARQVARFIGANHNTCLKLMKQLAENNTLEVHFVASSYQFKGADNAYFNFFKDMIQKENFVKSIYAKISLFFSTKEVSSVIVFGSYARTQEQSFLSDLDLCLVVEDGVQDDLLFKYRDFFDEIKKEFCITIEIITFSKKEFSSGKKDVIKTIIKEGVFLIGDRSKYV